MVKFPNHRHMLSFDERDHIIRKWCYGQDPFFSLALWSFSFVAIAFFMTYTCSYDYEIMQLLNTGGTLLGFVTSIVGEVSLGPLDNAHHISPASIATNELVAGWCITKRVKRLVDNEIELGIEIPTIESQASNIPMTKGTKYVFMRSDR